MKRWKWLNFNRRKQWNNTVVVVTSQIFLVDKEVVIFIQLPKFAVDDVEMLVTEIVGDLIDVFFVFKQTNSRQ